MKKVSRERLRRLDATAMKRWRRRLRRRSKRRDTVERVIKAPEILSFNENFNETITFLNGIRDVTATQATASTMLHVDLVPITRLSVPVAIVLAAEFHRWRIARHVRLRARNSTRWKPEVRTLLSELGAFDLLGIAAPEGEKGLTDHIVLTPLESGVSIDNEKIDQLQAKFRRIVEGLTNNPGLYDGMSEAVENAISHGYPSDFVPTHKFVGSRWWGAGCLDRENMRLRFFVFDQGAGIPFTLPKQAWFEKVLEVASLLVPGVIPTDSIMLRAAMEVGRTRTGQAHRGLGLATMADVILGVENSYLRILSGKGEINCFKDGTVETKDRDYDIGGTLIEWCLPADALMGNSENDDENS